MSEPVRVQPVTLKYSGHDAALGEPIPHPGMELTGCRPDVGRIVRQALFGMFYAASAVFVFGWLSEACFPRWSDFRLMLPIPPTIGMCVIGFIAHRLSKREATYVWAFGLWLGGFSVLGLFFVYLMGIGYWDLVAAQF